MGRFNLIGPSYRSQSVLADDQQTMNLYPELIESGQGRSAAALYPTPGLNQLYNLGNAPMRGLGTFQGRTFAITGTTLWELLAPNLAPNTINRGQVPSLTPQAVANPVCMAGGGHQVLIASAGLIYVFDLTTNVLTPITPFTSSSGPLLPVQPIPVNIVGYSDGFFFALVENAGTPWQINSSNLGDATTWQGTNFTIVNVFPDNPLAIFFAARLMWVFGPNGIQPYANTGDFPFPFDVIPGTKIENGLAARFAIAKIDNSLMWLGGDERGNGMVWRANGFTPVRVSNHAIEYALQSYSTIADAIAYSYQDQGHSFFVLNFPTADKTWVYDVATGQWHERGFWNTGRASFNRHRAAFHTFNFGMHLVGDPTTGAVYQMAINIFSDFGNPIRRVRRAPHVSKELEWVYHQRLQIDVEVGLGPNPPFQGNQPATLFFLTDAAGVAWQLGMTYVGSLALVKSNAGAPAPVYLTDPAAKTSWQIVPSILGQPNPVPVPYSNLYPGGLQMVSLDGNTLWMLQVRQVAPGIAQLVSMPLGNVARGPLMTLRWSNDGGQSWSNPQDRDCGQAGDYRKRVLWNRLGRARSRIYEISMSDAVPWRIIDGYLMADGFEPSERLSKDFAKRA